jgi:Tfp pilus assembly protein PilV
MFFNKNIKNFGFGLIEVVIGVSIITTGIVALIASYTVYVNYAFSNMENVQAAYVAEEGLEAMTFIRDNGWTTNIVPLSTTTTYYLVFESNIWKATTTPQYVDGSYLRKITLGDVRRDSGGEIVSSGGTVDTDSRLITSRVEYFQGKATSTRSISTYLTNINDD